AQVSESLSHSEQPLVPERVFVAGAAGENGQANGFGQGLLGTLLGLLVAEKSGFQMTESADLASLKEYADRMTSQVLQSMPQNGGEAKPAVAADQVEKVAKADG